MGPHKTTSSLVYVLLLLLALRASTNSIGSAVRKSGLATTWLQHVSVGELGEIREKCSMLEDVRSSSRPNGNSSAATHRIIDGEFASPGEFPHAAAVFMTVGDAPVGHDSYCGATLISRRHLLTAAHCIGNALRFDKEPSVVGSTFRLQLGGVCLVASDRSEEQCTSGDMLEVQVELLVKEFYLQTPTDRGLYARSERDFAIIQLREPLPPSLFASDNGAPAKAGIACLPQQSSSAIPPRLTMAAWGSRGGSLYELPTHHLRYVHGSSRVPDDFDGIINCYPPLPGRESLPVSDICMFRLGDPKRAFNAPGDSGSGVVGTRTSPPYVLYGVHAMWGRSRNGYDSGISMAVTNHLGDLCYYISLCAKADHLPVPRLLLSSAYITVPRRELPPIPPFRMNSDAELADQAAYCDSLQELTTPPAFKWLAAVIIEHGEGRHVCTATRITSAHLLTTRNCLVSRLNFASLKGGAVSPVKVRVEIKTGDGSDELWALQPEFIAWSHLSVGYRERLYTNQAGLRLSLPPNPPDSELAIVQLTEADAERIRDLIGHEGAVKPACLEIEPNDGGYGGRVTGAGLHAIAYGWSSTGDEVKNSTVLMRGKFGNLTDPMPSDILLAEDAASITYRHQSGDGLVDKRNARVLGLLVGGGRGDKSSSRWGNHSICVKYSIMRQESQANGADLSGLLLYMHLWDYAAVLCTFLNLNCHDELRNGASYLDNRVAFFDRFIYPQ